jgi:hypothetical protein
MTTQYRATRREVSSDLNFNLSHIKRSLQNDLDRVTAIIEAVEVWADKAPMDDYDGEAAGRIYDLLSITNNSGWISYLESAIRCASIKKASA